jgi:hypothetical protein
MNEDIINQKRIRDKAPYRKSMSLTEEDMMRASELERIFNTRFTSEAPFNFSKTISKALEIAIGQVLQPAGQSNSGAVQQALTGLPADQGALEERREQRQGLGNRSEAGNRAIIQRSGKPKKYQKKKRGS